MRGKLLHWQGSCPQYGKTGRGMLPFWWNCHLWLYWNLHVENRSVTAASLPFHASLDRSAWHTQPINKCLHWSHPTNKSSPLRSVLSNSKGCEMRLWDAVVRWGSHKPTADKTPMALYWLWSCNNWDVLVMYEWQLPMQLVMKWKCQFDKISLLTAWKVVKMMFGQ